MKQPKKVSGIVCEFNPFHFGHQTLIESARKNGSSHIVCVMSGNFVQRGEPAILDKWDRAKTAILCGADLVLELPVPFSLSGAERFAQASIFLLSALGVVDELCFGSECGEKEPLLTVAQCLLTSDFSEALKKEQEKGLPFAKVRSNAVAKLCGPKFSDLLSKPNNILGIEYCKALLRQHSNMQIFTIPRKGAAHDAAGQVSGFSAGALRTHLQNGKDLHGLLPENCLSVVQEAIKAGRAPASLKKIEVAVLAKLRSMDKSMYLLLPDISEGLENRIYAAVRNAASIEDLYTCIKTKRYAHARIRRIILSSFLGITGNLPALPPYLRVLALNQKGKEILSDAKPISTLPILTRFSENSALNNPAQEILKTECRASDLYALSLPKIAPCNSEMTHGIVVI